jgi:hypothetical protein
MNFPISRVVKMIGGLSMTRWIMFRVFRTSLSFLPRLIARKDHRSPVAEFIQSSIELGLTVVRTESSKPPHFSFSWHNAKSKNLLSQSP